MYMMYMTYMMYMYITLYALFRLMLDQLFSTISKSYHDKFIHCLSTNYSGSTMILLCITYFIHLLSQTNMFPLTQCSL